MSRERIRVATVERGDLVRDVSAQGNIVAAFSPTLTSPARGTARVDVNPGEVVERGPGPRPRGLSRRWRVGWRRSVPGCFRYRPTSSGSGSWRSSRRSRASRTSVCSRWSSRRPSGRMDRAERHAPRGTAQRRRVREGPGRACEGHGFEARPGSRRSRLRGRDARVRDPAPRVAGRAPAARRGGSRAPGRRAGHPLAGRRSGLAGSRSTTATR